MPEPKPTPAPKPIIKHCVLCHEDYDEVKDPYHMEGCRDARKP